MHQIREAIEKNTELQMRIGQNDSKKTKPRLFKPRESSTKDINTICRNVFIFPSQFALQILLPFDNIILTVDIMKSLERSKINAQILMRFNLTKHDMTENINILSDIGSSIFPISVILLFFRAMKPSKKSVVDAAKNRKSEKMYLLFSKHKHTIGDKHILNAVIKSEKLKKLIKIPEEFLSQ